MKNLNTVNFYRRAFRNTMDVRKVPLKSVTDQMKIFHDAQDGLPSADAEAIEFYYMNHITGDILSRKQKYDMLTEDEVKYLDRYFHICNEQAQRMFYYLLAICTRESRHCKSDSSFSNTIEAKYGSAVRIFHNDIYGKGSDETFEFLMNKPPNANLSDFTKHLEYVFFEGGFSGGFGGHMWGEVAKVLRQFVHGEFSPELMIDAAYNLSHNNGPIFNKHMFFTSYSHNFLRILDVQRSGQIPTYVKETGLVGSYEFSSSNTSELADFAVRINPTMIEDYVDWYHVEASGAVNSYGIQKVAQKEKHGLPASLAKNKKAQETLKLEKEKAEAKANENKVDLGFATFEKFERSQS